MNTELRQFSICKARNRDTQDSFFKAAPDLWNCHELVQFMFIKSENSCRSTPTAIRVKTMKETRHSFWLSCLQALSTMLIVLLVLFLGLFSFSSKASAEAPAQVTWTRCAEEGAPAPGNVCKVPSRRAVRYGASGVYTTKVVDGSIICSGSAFGVTVATPYPKFCDFISSPASTSGPIPNGKIEPKMADREEKREYETKSAAKRKNGGGWDGGGWDIETRPAGNAPWAAAPPVVAAKPKMATPPGDIAPPVWAAKPKLATPPGDIAPPVWAAKPKLATPPGAAAPSPGAEVKPKVAPPASNSQGTTEAHWNAWAEDDDGRLAEALTGGRKYKVTLDVSPYIYQTLSSAPVAGRIAKELGRLILDPKEKSLRLTIRVSLIGSGMELDGPNIDLPLKIDLNVFRTAMKRESESTLPADLVALRKDISLLPELGKSLGAGSVSVPVMALPDKTGCAQIAFTVWDEAGTKPLDHIVYSIPIAKNAKVEVTERTCPAPRIQGGFGSLAGPLSSKHAANIDAALHLYQFSTGTRTRTQAIYLDVAKYHSASPDVKKNSDRGLYSWTLKDNPKTYLGEKLPQIVATAREQDDYSGVARELRAIFFNFPASDRGSHGARGAFESLSRTASTKTTTPTVLVRAVMADGKFLYPPLAMLGAYAGEEGVAATMKRINIVYPLRREDFTESNCVDNWTVGYPEKLDDEELEWPSSEMPISGESELIPGRMKLLRNMPALKRYLNPPKAPDKGVSASGKPRRGEALLLVGHQDNAAFWFTGGGNDESRLLNVDNNRKFGPGSVAFLSACKIGNPSGDHQVVIDTFNENNVDAMVVSPFDVPAVYGRALALAAAKVVRNAYKEGETLTLTEIFEAAATQATKDLPHERLKNMPMEFVVLGNHELRLCRRQKNE